MSEPSRLQLHYTASLPMHYIAHDTRDDTWWLIPAQPMGSAAWAQRKPYRGNYELQRVRPTEIERFYQPPEDEPESDDGDGIVAMTLQEAADYLGFESTQRVSQLLSRRRRDDRTRTEIEEYIPPGVQGWETSNRVLVTRESVEEYKKERM